MSRGAFRNAEAELANRVEGLADVAVQARARKLKKGQWLTFEGRPGLRLNGGPTTFCYRYSSPVDGRTRQIKIGRWPMTSWERAVVRWEDLARDRADGVDAVLERRRKREEARQRHTAERKAVKAKTTTCAKLIETYLREHVAKEYRTERAAANLRRLFASRFIPEMGDRPAVSIDRGDATDFLARTKIEAPSLARMLRGRLGGAWDHAVARRLLPTDHANPWRDALRGKLSSRSRSRYLDDPELATFLAKLPTIENVNVRDALLIALHTAARSGEVVAMEWDAVDLERGTWTIRSTKTDQPRTIRLPRQALAILARRGRAFKMIRQTDLSLAIREARHMGLKPFGPHDLRRSARTAFARLGVRDEIGEAALGHVQAGIRGVYNLHAFEAEVGEALQKWCDHLDALASPTIVPMKSLTRSRRG